MATANLDAMIAEIQRKRRDQLSRIIGQASAPRDMGSLEQGTGPQAQRPGYSPLQSVQNLRAIDDFQSRLTGRSMLSQASSLIGSASTPVSYGVAAGSAAPTIVGTSMGAAPAAGSGILAAGTPVTGAGAGTGIMGALSSAGSAIGGAASSAGSAIGSGIMSLLSLFSTRRVKKEISTAVYRDHLRWVHFKYLEDIDPKQRWHLGLIAEEVAETNPEWVEADVDGQPIGVYYGRIPRYLWP